MLVVSRKRGEELLIGDSIRIVVYQIKSNRISIGIDAPNEVSILRGEVKDKGNDNGSGEDRS